MHFLRSLAILMISLMGIFSVQVSAQSADEKVIEFFSSNATMEDNPKQQNYNITIFSPDGEWKMQLNYNSESMFGTFGNEEFRLAGDGRYYNYARNPKNDMVFYSFTDMNVSVTNEGTLYRVKANCLTNNKMRFIVEATIDAPQPEETRTDDLGYARVEENPFYQTYAIYAENDNYTLAYGIASTELTGIFYRADMLMPELHDKKTNQDIAIINASAVHTKEGENTKMTVELLGSDRVLYQLTMFNGPHEVEIEREENILISGATLQDVTEMYGCFLFAGANEKYQLGIAVRPEAAESGRHEWTRDDLIMQYTRLYIIDEEAYAKINDIHVALEQANRMLYLKADITTIDGTLYHATMTLEQDGYMPEPKETINIDFGHIKVLDYTDGIGTVGIGAAVADKYQMRAYLHTAMLEGEFTTSDFVMDKCDIMVVNGTNYVFHDARYVNATMEKEGERTLITIDMYGIDDILYHGTMYLDPMRCLAEESSYSIGYKDEVTMMTLRTGDDSYGEYTLQFQNLDNALDDDYNIVGDGYYFSFYLGHDGYGVGGNYGYSEGTLADDEYHGFYENGCEVRLAPVAGTFTLEPVRHIKINLGAEMGIITTCLYQAQFQFVGQNGSIYRGEGENYLLGIDDEGYFFDVHEDSLDSIRQSLAEQGYSIRKVLRDGKLIIEHQDKTYDVEGKIVK